MRTTFHLFGIIFFGALMGVGAYTKLREQKPVAVALNIQEASLDRPTKYRAVPTTGKAESVSESGLLAFKEAELKRQQLLQRQNKPKATAAKTVNSHSMPESLNIVALEKTEEHIAIHVESTHFAPPAESLVESAPAPIKQDSTAAAPKKKRKFLGIFPIKDKKA